jgi:proteasome lid subunit RPN8/RPN11
MLKHGRAGVPMEVMGLMLGEFVDDYTVRVIDVFAMPQSGTVSLFQKFASKDANIEFLTNCCGSMYFLNSQTDPQQIDCMYHSNYCGGIQAPFY